MPDPIDELDNFTTPGLTMTPLPASEVRRRGTRMRRRNTALATVGGIAAVAVIATPLAVIASQGDRGSEVQPAPQPHSWVQTIPDGFDLTVGMPAGTPQRDAFSFDVSGICGSPAWAFDLPEPGVDGLGARDADPGTDGGTSRALVLYADEAAATESLDNLGAAVEACPTDPNDGGAPLVNDVVAASDGSLVFTQQAKDGDLLYDLTVYQAVRSGNALYLASSHTAAGGEQVVDSEVRRLQAASVPVVDQMCVFSADGCGEAGVAATVIADGFDLVAGLPTEGASEDFGRVGPDRDLAPIDLDACGQPAPDTEALDVLRGGFTDPAYENQRQLMTFPDEGTAQSYLDSVAALFPCTTEPSRGLVGEYEPVDSRLGDSSVTAFLRYTVDGEPGLGHEIVHLVRVGQAVLLVRIVSDGDSTPVTDDVRADLLDQSTAELTDVIATMCVFSDTGC